MNLRIPALGGRRGGGLLFFVGRHFPSISTSAAVCRPIPAAAATAIRYHSTQVAPWESKSLKGRDFMVSLRGRTSITEQVWNQRLQSVFESEHVATRDPDFNHLLTKTPQDSFISVELPFASDPRLRAQYVNFMGDLRMGLLLEDMDSVAATSAYCHASDQNPETRALSIVTASVDRIDLMQRLTADFDMIMQGRVVRVGRSSMTVRLDMLAKLDANDPTKLHPILSSLVTMVARYKNASAPVHHLASTTDEEVEWCKLADRHMAQRRILVQESPFKKPFSEEESLIVHNLFREQQKCGQFQADCSGNAVVTPQQTAVNSVVVCMPQDRNFMNKIFGGFIMRKTFELAWASAYMFSKTRPILLSMDDFSFVKPVEVGSILNIKSCIVYNKGGDSRSFVVKVGAYIVNPQTGAEDLTNEFHAMFCAQSGSILPRIVPKSIEESVMYLEGRRRLEHSRSVSNDLRSPYAPLYDASSTM